MRYRALWKAVFALCLLFGAQPPAFCDTAGIDPRDIALDKSLGGMKEGSRILSPHGEIHTGGHRLRGTPGSHAGSAAETHQPAASITAPGQLGTVPGANRGLLPGGSSGGTPGAENQAGIGTPHEGTGANLGTETGPLSGNTGGTLETGGGTETGGSSGGVQEPAGGGTSESSIIEVEADANLETDNPSAGGDVTINPDAGGGQNSIIEADVGVDVSGGAPTAEAEVTVDPNADGGLVDAEATTSSDIVEQELTSSAGLEVDNGANTTAAETTTVGTETGSTTAPATNEVTGGVEADVEGAGAGDDVECNPADGLLCPPKL